jgi:single-strand DNA-binding protein
MMESAMSGSVNKVILVGNLGRDPEVRKLNSGDSVVNFSLATTESWRDKATGERKERTEWHNIVIFNENLGKIVEQYCKKGSKVYLEGQLQTREFTDREGNQRKTTEVVLQRFRGELTLLDSRGAASRSEASERDALEGSGAGNFGRSSPMEPTEKRGRVADMIDDDIPF